MSTRLKLFAPCSPGLESLLLSELRELGQTGKALAGGVEFSADSMGLWQVSHQSRIAESVRVRLKRFRAHDFQQFVDGAAKLPWHAYLKKGARFSLHVTSKKSALYHTNAIAERLAQLLQQQRESAQWVSPRTPANARVFVRLEQDSVQCSVDATGAALHKRGYRTHVVRASIRETLGAALARLLSEARPRSVGDAPELSPRVVWDPFCGAGTLLLECSAPNVGLDRQFAFEGWPTHRKTAYDEWRALQLARDVDSTSSAEGFHLIGSDRSAHAINSARANADLLQPNTAPRRFNWLHGDFEKVSDQVPRGAAVLSNPPYGRRVQKGEAQRTLARFEALLARRTDLRPVVVAAGGDAKPGAVLGGWTSVARFSNGGQPAQAWRLD